MQKNVYKERGGIHIGDSDSFDKFNATWPSVKIEIDDSILRISYPFHKIIQLKKSDIMYIENYKVLFFNGIKILHNRKDLSNYIFFWSFRIQSLMKFLRDKNWPVKEEPKPENDDDSMWLKA
ncbi:hypothetical protein K8T06_06345 [bacterium]|nr:hypothetical protein [bacterium]